MAVSYARLHPTLKKIVSNLPRVSQKYGFRYRITSAYRSPQKQAALYRSYLAGKMPYAVAPPGTSAHERGLALDIISDNPAKMVPLLTSAGLFWGGEGDPVHFSLIASPSAKKGAFSSYREEVGSSIPSVLTKLPLVGRAFSLLKDPWTLAKTEGSKLIDAIFGFL